MSNTPTALRSLLLGVLSGGRSATPLAALALHHDDAALKGSWQQWPMFRTSTGRGLLISAALGELVVDKLPKVPSRVRPLALIGRMGAGALAGVAISTTGPKNRALESALLGALGALVGSYAGYLARTAIGGGTELPDTVVALAEDTAVVAGAARVLR